MANSQQPRILIVDARDAGLSTQGTTEIAFPVTFIAGSSVVSYYPFTGGCAFRVANKTVLTAVGYEPAMMLGGGTSRRVRLWSVEGDVIGVILDVTVSNGFAALATRLLLQPGIEYRLGIDLLNGDRIGAATNLAAYSSLLLPPAGYSTVVMAAATSTYGYPDVLNENVQRAAGQVWLAPYIQPNYDSFTVSLKPAICGLRGVRLLYANIGNPEDNDVDLYWLLRVGEFGVQCRTANSSDGATFVVPVNSAQGFRTLHRGETDFSHIVLQQPAADIHRLSVDLFLPGCSRPAIAEPWFFVLELTYE